MLAADSASESRKLIQNPYGRSTQPARGTDTVRTSRAKVVRSAWAVHVLQSERYEMAQKWIRVALLAAFAAVVVAASVVPSVIAQDKDKKMSIKEIMGAAHKGDDNLINKIKSAVKAGKWEDAQTAAKTLAENGTKLGKNTPKRGDKDSWEMLTKKYAENTKAVADATEKKDADATKTAIGTVVGSCKECHDAHRGKGK